MGKLWGVFGLCTSPQNTSALASTPQPDPTSSGNTTRKSVTAAPAAPSSQPSQLDASQALNLRHGGTLPAGRCVYIQAGDPGDFDGYFIATAGWLLQRHTEGLTTVVVVPERRACPDRTEADVNKHDPSFSEQVLETANKILCAVSPDAFTVKGPLNERNIIPLKFIFSEPEKYGPLVADAPSPPDLHSLKDLADLVNDPSVTSVVMDVNGSIGYFLDLIAMAPDLGKKIKASGMPITVMAGVSAEVQTATLPVPGRDPRSTMNAIYSQKAISEMLQLAKADDVPLLMVTNNVCNKELKFEDFDAVCKAFGLQGLLSKLAEIWYGPHLRGKCVPFDWVSFVAMCLATRQPALIKTEIRELHVGEHDASILVLKDPKLEVDMTTEVNMEGTYLWGTVDSLVSIDQEIMLSLARQVSSSCPQ